MIKAAVKAAAAAFGRLKGHLRRRHHGGHVGCCLRVTVRTSFLRPSPRFKLFVTPVQHHNQHNRRNVFFINSRRDVQCNLPSLYSVLNLVPGCDWQAGGRSYTYPYAWPPTVGRDAVRRHIRLMRADVQETSGPNPWSHRSHEARQTGDTDVPLMLHPSLARRLGLGTREPPIH